MVLLKSWVSFGGTVSQSRRFLCYVSNFRLKLLFLSRVSYFFFRKVSESRILFFEHLGILSDQTRIYLKDIVFGPQNI